MTGYGFGVSSTRRLYEVCSTPIVVKVIFDLFALKKNDGLLAKCHRVKKKKYIHIVV